MKAHVWKKNGYDGTFKMVPLRSWRCDGCGVRFSENLSLTVTDADEAARVREINPDCNIAAVERVLSL